MRAKRAKKDAHTEVQVLFHPTSRVHANFVVSQVKWWLLVTGFIISVTLVPGVFIAKQLHDWAEIFDSVVITLGVRTLAILSKLIIDKLFNFINEGEREYVVRGGRFFTDDNPLNQLLIERRNRNQARTRKIGDRTHQMASHPRVWLVLIVLSYVVRLAPDMLGASLVAQSEPFRIVEPIETITAPDFGFGDAEGLRLRGNCVWTRVGQDARDVERRFGYIIWQYCVDLFRDQEVDSEFRTLRGNDSNGESVKAVFHIEVITEDVFTESWEPFSNKTHAQRVFDAVLADGVRCANDVCEKNYRTEDMKIIYGLLTRVGMHARELRGDDDSVRKLRRSTGRVIARLAPATRTSFLVLIVAVNVILLAQSLSTGEHEAEHIALLRAVGELKGVSGASQLTAIALPRVDMGRRWATRDTQCYVVGSARLSAAQLLQRVSGARAAAEAAGGDGGGGEAGDGDLTYTRDGRRFVRATVQCEALQYGT